MNNVPMDNVILFFQGHHFMITYSYINMYGQFVPLLSFLRLND